VEADPGADGSIPQQFTDALLNALPMARFARAQRDNALAQIRANPGGARDRAA
jgi:hypothetical protein